MTDKEIRKYCEGLDCAFCAEKEPCIYRIANRLEEQLKAKEQECEELKKQTCGLRSELKYIIDKTCCKYNINAKYYHEKIVEIINNLDKYKQTLAEINECLTKNACKGWVSTSEIDDILQKISEVEDEIPN